MGLQAHFRIDLRADIRIAQFIINRRGRGLESVHIHIFVDGQAMLRNHFFFILLAQFGALALVFAANRIEGIGKELLIIVGERIAEGRAGNNGADQIWRTYSAGSRK